MKRQIAALLASGALVAASGAAFADTTATDENTTPVAELRDMFESMDHTLSNQPEQTSGAAESGESK